MLAHHGRDLLPQSPYGWTLWCAAVRSAQAARHPNRAVSVIFFSLRSCEEAQTSAAAACGTIAVGNMLHASALAGACAGLVSSIVTCPLDVVKTKLQAQSGPSRPLRSGWNGPAGHPNGGIGGGAAREAWERSLHMLAKQQGVSVAEIQSRSEGLAGTYLSFLLSRRAKLRTSFWTWTDPSLLRYILHFIRNDAANMDGRRDKGLLPRARAYHFRVPAHVGHLLHCV